MQHLESALQAGAAGFQISGEAPNGKLFQCDQSSNSAAPSLWGHICFFIDENTLVFHGGQSADSTPLNTAWQLDLRSGAWQECAASSTQPLQFHGVSAIRDMSMVVMFGGESSHGNELSEVSEAHCFDTSLELWYPAATTGAGPHARSGHAMATILQGSHQDLNQSGDSSGTHSVLRRVMQASGMSSSFSSPAVQPHSSAPGSAATLSSPAASAGGDEPVSTPTVHDSVQDSSGSAVLVHGGVKQGRFVNDVHVLDMNTYRWSKSRPTGSPPGPRAYHTLTAIGAGQVVLIGGSDDRQAFGDVHVLDTACHPWAWSEPCTTGIHPAARSGHVAVRVSPRHILVAGGWNPHSEHPQPHQDAYLLDVTTWHWIPITKDSMPTSCSSLTEAGAAPMGGSKRAASGPVDVPQPSSKRRGTRAAMTAVAAEEVSASVDFGVWSAIGRVGACAQAIGSDNAAIPHECGLLLHGGKDQSGKPCSDTFLLPLPLDALQARAEGQA